MLATDLAKEFADAGVDAIICTDVGRDGTLSGVNIAFTKAIAEASGIDTIASGGVSGLDDLKRVKAESKIYGAIIGKAYYEGKLDIKEAFNL
jgi:phosphoribosylformimino-5-aminoimidazole carboxamide ribotide isomerase